MATQDSAKRAEAAKIAEAAMPGWTAMPNEELADAAVAAEPPTADATLAPQGDLRRKYLGEPAEGADAAPGEAYAEDDTVIVTLKSGPLTKAVGIQGGKVKWSQG